MNAAEPVSTPLAQPPAPYWRYLTRNLALSVLLAWGLARLLGWPAETAKMLYWGAFYGFAYVFSMKLFESLRLYVLFFVFSLIRILFFGYCMVLTAGHDPARILLVLGGCFGYLLVLWSERLISARRQPAHRP